MANKKKLLAYFGHHKCATVWIHKIMHELWRAIGRKAVNLHSPGQFHKNLALYLEEHGLDCLTYANADGKYVAQLENFAGFHVVRDPRDLAVSSYFSHLYSHPTDNWPQLENHREKLKTLPREKGMILDIEFIHQDVFQRMKDWNYHQENVLEIKMEDLTAHPLETFMDILGFLGMLDENPGRIFHKGLTRKKLEKVLKKNSFNRLSGGRKPGQENPKHHFRKGTPGDWRNHFTDPLKSHFKEHYQPLLSKLGYENHDRW